MLTGVSYYTYFHKPCFHYNIHKREWDTETDLKQDIETDLKQDTETDLEQDTETDLDKIQKQI